MAATDQRAPAARPGHTVFRRGILVLPALALLAGCGSSGSSSAASPSEPTNPPTTASSGTCTAPLVRLRTGQDPACGGGNAHLWPVGLERTACHGWSSPDTTGRQHTNSAADIRCNPDGSFTFTQYAGNLSCSGSGVIKTYTLGACEQDIPPTLYTVATDLACCTSPGSPACTIGTPSVSVPGSTIFLNGSSCGG